MQTDFKRDGDYMNLLNRYGTMQDSATAWSWQGGGAVPDMVLAEHYETNGLFAKIIDAPAEEAVKHGFELGICDAEAEEALMEALDALDWEERMAQAVRWARLFGGAIAVMVADDGRGLEEPLDMKKVKSVEELRVFERAAVQPEQQTAGAPESYFVNAPDGQFRVHASRCLVFRNGCLPLLTTQHAYRHWGIPEYLRIKKELRETVTSHGTAVKMLERSVLPVFAMSGLSEMLSTEEGRRTVLERMKAIDGGRSVLSTVVIDTGGDGGGNESYDFRTFPLAGVKDVIETTYCILSAVTGIPQTILLGRSPAGMSATGKGDLESWYNHVERIQKLMLRANLKKLAETVAAAAVNSGGLAEKPKIRLKFKPLWSMTEEEEARLAQTRAQTRLTNAQIAKTYMEMGVLDPSEIRRGLAEEGDFCVEGLLEETGGEMPAAWEEEEPIDGPPEQEKKNPENQDGAESRADGERPGGVGVIVESGGRILTALRTESGLIGGPGGHIDPGESPKAAARRETTEEFGVEPKKLKPLGQLESRDRPQIFLCKSYRGSPRPDGEEMRGLRWMGLAELLAMPKSELFPPFRDSLMLYAQALGDKGKPARGKGGAP